jgi:hypothetical protein
MLLSPNQIHNVLKETVLAKKSETTPESLEEMLNESSLGKREVLNTIGDLMRGADSSGVRLSAAKLAGELHGIINSKSDGVAMPNVTIIIRDSEFSFNPILVPRS